MTRKPLAVANWKMNHGVAETIKFITEFARGSLPDNVDIVVCPPFTSLYTMSVALADNESIIIGAQNCHYEDKGAFTGEISIDFLKEVSCQYVIIGHSERRSLFHEDDKLLNKKITQVLENGLTPIFCIGEHEEQRESGKTFDVITTQLENGLRGLSKDQVIQSVLAYEPVWAIGTGKTATPGQAQEVHAFIRHWVGQKHGTSYAQELRILYGGSVKPDNINNLMAQADIDGALVGGASLKADQFIDIVTGCR